jgi:hypothetical protein
MHKFHVSISGMSILMALLLALWEWYFFWFAGKHVAGPLEGTLGLFVPERLGFNLAWLVCLYLSFQLISIPFALPATGQRFVGVVDGMASIVPLSVVAVVLFGRSDLLDTHARWEAAFLLLVVNAVDLFGGYAFNIALSRRIFDVAPAGPA